MVDLRTLPVVGMVDEDDNEDYLNLNAVQSFQIELVRRITKDAINKMGTDPTGMSKDEVRFLVSSYYAIQEMRKLVNNRAEALIKRNDPASIFHFISSGVEITEKNILKFLTVASNTHEIGRWAESIRGIGPVISAGLLAHIDINKAPTVGHIWRFAGLDPTLTWLGREKSEKLVNDLVGRGTKATDAQFIEIATAANRKVDSLMRQVQAFAESKGTGSYLTKSHIIKTLAKRPWNADLKLICWKAGDSFVKVSNHKDDIYGHEYAARKLVEIQKNEAGEYAQQAKVKAKQVGKDTDAYKAYSQGILPPGHIHARATRYAVKLFLSHWHHVAYESTFGTPPPKPYILNQDGHTHYLAPPNWPMK